MAYRGGATMVFVNSLLKLPLRFSNVVGVTILALYVVNNPGLFFFRDLVLRVHEMPPDRVVRPEVDLYASFSDYSGYCVRDVAYVGNGNTPLDNTFLPLGWWVNFLRP